MSEEWNNATPADLKKARRGKVQLRDPLKTDRLPPHSIEAEQGVLGCILLAPAECLSECLARRFTAGYFYDLRHQQIYHAITEIYHSGTPVDTITLMQWLSDRKLLDTVGGLAYMASLPDAVPSAANLDHYMEIVRAKLVLRRAIATCADFVGRAYEHTGDVDLLMDELQNDTLKLTEGVIEQRARTFKQIMPMVLDDLEDSYHRGHTQIKGITTGFDYLDKILCGMGQDQGNFYVLAARPGVGKSALSVQLAKHVACDYKWFTPKMDAAGKAVLDEDKKKPAEWIEHRGVPVGIFSLEMTARALVCRSVFQQSGVDAQRFKTGYASKQDFERLAMAAPVLNKLPIHVDQEDSLTVEGLAARARLMVRQHGIKLFIVDYIQCLQVATKRFRPDRVQEMAEISNGLRRLTKQLNVPFLVLAQMNRDFAKEQGVRKPRLEDLRDSGAIEQDAEVVMFLYEHEMSEQRKSEFEADVAQATGRDLRDDWCAMPKLMKLLVSKNRHGMNNKSAQLLFDASCQRFYDYIEWRKRNGLKEPARGERTKNFKKSAGDDDML